MCDTFSSKKRNSHGSSAGFGGHGYYGHGHGHTYGYPHSPRPPHGYGSGPGPGAGYGFNNNNYSAPPPSYDSHFEYSNGNANSYGGPSPSHSPHPPFASNNPYNSYPSPYPHEKPNGYPNEQVHGSHPPGPGAGENTSYYNGSHPPRHNGPSSGPGPGYGPRPGAPGPMHGRAHSMNGPHTSMPMNGPPPMAMNNGGLHPNMNTHPAPAPVPVPVPAPQSNSPRSLLLRQSPKTHKIILIHLAGSPIDSPPLYSLTSSPKSSKADYVLARGGDPNDSSTLIGEVQSHTFSSKYDLVVRGISCLLKESAGGSNYNIEIPGMGKYKWITDMENLSSVMWLKDASKSSTLATYDKSKEKSSVGAWKMFVGGKDRELTVHVPLNEFFVEVLLVSLYAVKMAKEGAMEAAVEIVGAVAGA
ncbi:uncharacterized protein BDV17DRAFT_290746 [Aspergillus undulatus]|uniref:uncharacterized protein n=1 Tax=Aspergillus undulatus TaxID=1810928 RepID=UPI003CCDAA3A